MPHRWLAWALIGTVTFCLSLGLEQALGHSPSGSGSSSTAIPAAPIEAAAASSSYAWDLPGWVPRPLVPADNPMSAEKVELGRRLFYETRLSVNGAFSCATCHLQHLAFSDGKARSPGATGQRHPLNSMSLTNVAYNTVQTWANPLMQHLEQQMLVPLFGEDPVELGMAGKENELLAMLVNDPDYRQRFEQVFGQSELNQGEPNPVSIRNLTLAIAAFERTLNSFNSPYDRYRYGGDPSAISDSAKRGEALFTSERLECFHCHSGLNFSDSSRHERSGFAEMAFHNTGLYNIDGRGAYPPEGTGLEAITLNPEDMGKFRAPTLRNIALTAPYMHDGSIETLEEVIDHYAAGGRTIERGPNAGIGSQNPFKSSFVVGFALTEAEKQDLVAFLNSLTDERFVTNPKLGPPQ
ncbi:MAG: di-heme enzyme [Synechococcales cyanobacterium RM1_1_8]|nr:di-heme enzyme [Synechococcales cyanobacterium RM1_1_8]